MTGHHNYCVNVKYFSKKSYYCSWMAFICHKISWLRLKLRKKYRKNNSRCSLLPFLPHSWLCQAPEIHPSPQHGLQPGLARPVVFVAEIEAPHESCVAQLDGLLRRQWIFHSAGQDWGYHSSSFTNELPLANHSHSLGIGFPISEMRIA